MSLESQTHGARADAGVAAMVAYVMRVHPALSAMRDEIVAGRFGRPVQIIGCSGQHFPTYRPAYREIYYTDRATGGGAIMSSASYDVHCTMYIVHSS